MRRRLRGEYEVRMDLVLNDRGRPSRPATGELLTADWPGTLQPAGPLIRSVFRNLLCFKPFQDTPGPGMCVAAYYRCEEIARTAFPDWDPYARARCRRRPASLRAPSGVSRGTPPSTTDRPHGRGGARPGPGRASGRGAARHPTPRDERARLPPAAGGARATRPDRGDLRQRDGEPGPRIARARRVRLHRKASPAHAPRG